LQPLGPDHIAMVEDNPGKLTLNQADKGKMGLEYFLRWIFKTG
jgi:hypothetical protein